MSHSSWFHITLDILFYSSPAFYLSLMKIDKVDWPIHTTIVFWLGLVLGLVVVPSRLKTRLNLWLVFTQNRRLSHFIIVIKNIKPKIHKEQQTITYNLNNTNIDNTHGSKQMNIITELSVCMQYLYENAINKVKLDLKKYRTKFPKKTKKMRHKTSYLTLLLVTLRHFW